MDRSTLDVTRRDDRSIATGVVEVLHGRNTLLDRFASTFRLAACPLLGGLQ
ncbi:hypothetical protein [uncultured Friedmanniella sp.]|uniref:hypothetical protein n=1 Tax=uncultured Friedmanniella sp. TaxID=335381 RepID=UPI0035C9B77B